MKVVAPGSVFFHNGLLVTRGWLLDHEGAKFTDPMTEQHVALRTIFSFLIANYAGGDAAVDPTGGSVPADVERLTQDVIAVARWPEQT